MGPAGLSQRDAFGRTAKHCFATLELNQIPTAILCKDFLHQQKMEKGYHKWARQDLNLRPIDYESTALTN